MHTFNIDMLLSVNLIHIKIELPIHYNLCRVGRLKNRFVYGKISKQLLSLGSNDAK